MLKNCTKGIEGAQQPFHYTSPSSDDDCWIMTSLGLATEEKWLEKINQEIWTVDSRSKDSSYTSIKAQVKIQSRL